MRTLERGRSKHNDLVAQLNRLNLKRDKAVEALVRIESKRNSLIRAIARSQKRLAKAATAAMVNESIGVFNDGLTFAKPDDDGSIPEFLRR